MNTTRHGVRIAATLALLSNICACGMGNLGQSHTADDCAPDDVSCLMRGLGAPLAVGATASPTIATRLRGSGAPSLHLWSAAPSVMTVRDHTITGVSDGVSGLMMAMDDEVVIDFVHVWVKTPTRIQLHRFDSTGRDLGELNDRIELLAGESVRLAPRPYAGAQALLGEGPAEWRVEPPIATIMREGARGRRRLLARRPGKAVVTVSSLGQYATFDLVVEPAVSPRQPPAQAVPPPPQPAAPPPPEPAAEEVSS